MTNAETYIRSALERASMRTRDCVDTRADEPGSYAYNLEKSVILLRALLSRGTPECQTTTGSTPAPQQAGCKEEA